VLILWAFPRTNKKRPLPNEKKHQHMQYISKRGNTK